MRGLPILECDKGSYHTLPRSEYSIIPRNANEAGSGRITWHRDTCRIRPPARFWNAAGQPPWGIDEVRLQENSSCSAGGSNLPLVDDLLLMCRSYELIRWPPLAEEGLTSVVAPQLPIRFRRHPGCYELLERSVVHEPDEDFLVLIHALDEQILQKALEHQLKLVAGVDCGCLRRPSSAMAAATIWSKKN